MPREQITHNHVLEKPQRTPDEAIITFEDPRRNVHVQWNRDAHWLQLGVDVPLAELRDLLADAERAAAAEARMQPPGVEYAVDAHPVRIVSDVLSRSETNATITTLRRARDAAYGRDA